VSTLDGRTTLRCAKLDGTEYALGEGPRPPVHWSCRSVTVPLIRSFAELLDRNVQVDAKQRAALDGQAPARQTYPQWLRKQDAKTQDFIFGPTRARLFREGKVPIQRFSDRRGRAYTLEELAVREGLAEDPTRVESRFVHALGRRSAGSGDIIPERSHWRDVPRHAGRA
jgi:hypothetical protein